MSPFRLTPVAEDDLFDIWSFIAPDNLLAADLLQTELLGACQ
jgi:plasmid stabilization system protein ParE